MFQKRNPVQWLAAVVSVALLAFAAAGCGGNGAVPPEGEGPDPSNGAARVEVLLFFTDAHAVDTDNPGEFGYVAPVLKELPAGGDLLQRSVEALIEGPGPAEGEYYSTLPVTTRVLSVEVAEGVAEINLSHEVLADSPGGSLGGVIFIQSLVLTATQFAEVDRVLVLVEGETWSDGHSIWDKPLGPDDL